MGTFEPMQAEDMQRQIVRLVLERERELVGLERLLGSGAVAAVKTLAADRVVVRHGERLWASRRKSDCVRGARFPREGGTRPSSLLSPRTR